MNGSISAGPLGLAAATVTPGVRAADLPPRTGPPPLQPAFTWTGVNAGYAVSSGGGRYTDPTYGTVTGGSRPGGFANGGGARASNAAAYPNTLPGHDSTGYAAGGGLAYAFTDKLSAGIEALYLHLGDGFRRPTDDNAAVPAFYGPGRQEAGDAVVRAGVSYRSWTGSTTADLDGRAHLGRSMRHSESRMPTGPPRERSAAGRTATP